jgi:hypothetical protein
MEMTEGLLGGVLGADAQGFALVPQTTAMDQWQPKLAASNADRNKRGDQIPVRKS